MSANLLHDTSTARARAVPDEWGSSERQPAQATPLMRVVPDPASPAETEAAPPHKRLGGALYTLEAPAYCPECNREIRTLRVLRVLRTQVSFTSTLPRKGYVIVCPECDRLLSAELSGLV